MKRRGIALFDLLFTAVPCLILIAVLIPIFSRARDNARRSSCQSNLKHICLALWQYAADNNGNAPSRDWDVPLRPYIKEDAVFRCPAKGSPQGRSDYFFNGRFLKKKLEDVSLPQTLILLGDGSDGLPISQLPDSWLKDGNSPAWRHLDGANYGFADGHIKWLKPNRVSRDFRMVTP